MQIHVSTEITSPAPVVFSYLTNPDKLIQWQTFLAEAKQLSEGEIRVGSRFRNVLKHPGFDDFGVLTLEITGEVQLIEPDTRLKIKGHSNIADLIIDYRLHQIDERTTVQQTAVFELRGLLLRPITNLMSGFLTEQFETDLMNLKLLIESEQRPE